MNVGASKRKLGSRVKLTAFSVHFLFSAACELWRHSRDSISPGWTLGRTLCRRPHSVLAPYPENLRFQRPDLRQDRPAEPLTADRERNGLGAGVGVSIVKEHTVPVIITAALPADQGVCLFPLCRCHAVKGTVLPALYGRQSFIWILAHVFPPFCFPLPLSPKRLPASSSQAAYRSFHRKRQNSLAPLLLLSPQSHAALRGPQQWRLVSALARSPDFGTFCPEVARCGASPAGVFLFGRLFIFQGAAHR